MLVEKQREVVKHMFKDKGLAFEFIETLLPYQIQLLYASINGHYGMIGGRHNGRTQIQELLNEWNKANPAISEGLNEDRPLSIPEKNYKLDDTWPSFLRHPFSIPYEPYYITCRHCGANLDPGERCDCHDRDKN